MPREQLAIGQESGRNQVGIRLAHTNRRSEAQPKSVKSTQTAHPPAKAEPKQLKRHIEPQSTVHPAVFSLIKRHPARCNPACYAHRQFYITKSAVDRPSKAHQKPIKSTRKRTFQPKKRPKTLNQRCTPSVFLDKITPLKP